MSHLPIYPIVIPLAAAAILMMLHGLGSTAQRTVSVASTVALAITAVLMLASASDGTIRVYRLGDWPAPFGIVLVLDRLAALMVALTVALAAAITLASLDGVDRCGLHFHPLLQLQIAGLNGAFLTGDLFNLFVFFEILLLASYALLVHGGGLARVRAGLSYVILNLAGSALFLIALGLVYGTLGTLNIADLTLVLPRVGIDSQALVRTTMALLVAVFLFKAAIFPIGFWLPHVYTAALLPVAVLFVIMTKVGIYALLRLSTIGLGAAPFTADLLQPWLPWLAIATIALGSIGALAAKRLGIIIANLVMISSGILLLGVADGGTPAIAAMLAYLIHTTVVAAGLFLMTDLMARQRGTAADTFERGPRLTSFVMLGAVYLILGVAASGVPPMSGFITKLMVMQSIRETSFAAAGWTALLLSGFVVALVLARAASTLFWEPGKADKSAASLVLPPAVPSTPTGTTVALLGMVAIAIAITLGAAPVSRHARATAEQLAAPSSYIETVLGKNPAITRERRP